MTVAQELIHRFIEDPASLDEAGLEQLIAFLRAEPAKAVELRDQLIVDDLLGQKLALDRKNFLAQVEQRLADFERGEEEVYNQVSDLRAIAEAEIELSVRPPATRTWIKVAAGVSLIAVLIACGLAWQYQRSAPRPVANVEELIGEVVRTTQSGQEPLRLGQALSTGDAIVASPGSTVVWKYKDGTTVRILGDTLTHLGSDSQTLAKQVKLDRGELVASIAKQTRGPMVFTTPHATATVRGTELRIVVAEANTQLDVTTGVVDFQRSAGGQVLQLAANESGIATSEKLQPKEVNWPLNRAAAIYLFEGTDKLAFAREPESRRPFSTPLQARGEASKTNRQTLLVSGGSYFSEDAGKDVLALLKRSGQFSLEVVFTPTRKSGPEAAVICSLGPARNESFVLVQTGQELRLRLHDGIGMPAMEVDLGEISPGSRHYLAFSYQDGKTSALVDGVEIAVPSDFRTTLETWEEGPLVLGADADGKLPWHGEIAGVAIYDQFVEKSLAEANRLRFKQLHP